MRHGGGPRGDAENMHSPERTGRLADAGRSRQVAEPISTGLSGVARTAPVVHRTNGRGGFDEAANGLGFIHAEKMGLGL